MLERGLGGSDTGDAANGGRREDKRRGAAAFRACPKLPAPEARSKMPRLESAAPSRTDWHREWT